MRLLTRGRISTICGVTRNAANASAEELAACVCRRGWRNLPMIECEVCFFWFHGECVGVDCENPPREWLCDDCEIRLGIDVDGSVSSSGEDHPATKPSDQTTKGEASYSSPDIADRREIFLVHCSPRFVLIQGSLQDVSDHLPEATVDFVATDPPSGSCQAVYEWDRRVTPYDFWMCLRRTLTDRAAVCMIGSGQFILEHAIRNQDLNQLLVEGAGMLSQEGWPPSTGEGVTQEDAQWKDVCARHVAANLRSRRGTPATIRPAIPVYKYSWYWLNNNMGFPLHVHAMPLRFVEEICVFYKSHRDVVYHAPAVCLPFVAPAFRSPDDARVYKGETRQASLYFNAELSRCAANFLPIPYQG